MKLVPVATLAAAGLLVAAAPAAAEVAQGETLYGLVGGTALTSFDARTPARVALPVAITGLQSGEEIEAIDVRPATGVLYGLGSTGRLYTLDPVTGKATQVGTGTFAVALRGAEFDLDFNPSVDRIRVVSDAEQNLRLNPNDGTVVDANTTTDGVQADGDINGAATNAGDQQVVAAAYTNNFAPTTMGATQLITIDAASNRQFVQNPPNDGTQSAPKALGLDVDATTGLDIAASDGTGYLLATVGGARRLYAYQPTAGTLAPGAGTPIDGSVRDIAVARQAPTLLGLLADGKGLTRLSIPQDATSASALAALTQGTTVAATGLQADETLVGIDVRPATGELYGVGSTGRLYRIDASSGAATQIGSGTFTPALEGAQFDIDFNPDVDRLRIVSDAQQNLRVNPETGAVVDGDAATAGVQGDGDLAFAPLVPLPIPLPLQPPPEVSGAAYTRNFPAGATGTSGATGATGTSGATGATGTTLYDIDTGTDSLYVQTPPNDGVLTDATPLTGPLAAIDAPLGFDISGQDGTPFLLATTADGSRLARLTSLETAATAIQGAPLGTALRDVTAVSAGAVGFGAAPTGVIAAEGSLATLDVTRADTIAGNRGTATVRLRLVPGGSAAGGSDVAAFDVAVTLPEGVDTVPVRIPIRNDGTAEGVESFTVALERAAGGYRLGATTQVVTIPASDGPGGTTTNTTPPPAPPSAARVLPRSVRTTVTPKRDRKKPFRFKTTVTVNRPAGVASSACTGKVRVQYKNSARKTIRTRTVNLRRTCKASFTQTFTSRTRFGRSGKVRVVARYLGNGTLRPRSAPGVVVRVR